MKLGKYNGWCFTYRGKVYANNGLTIHHRINNKVIIDRLHKAEIETLYRELSA